MLLQPATPTITPLQAWLILHQVPGVGPYRLNKLMQHWRSPVALINAKPAALLASGLTSAQIETIKQPHWELIRKLCNWAQGDQRHILSLDAAAYPRLLREIPDPPCVLFCHGNITLLSRPQLAIVGSRHASPNGRVLAQHFAQQLVQAGLVVTSGLALGIDAASHMGVLTANGDTIAVLGSGLEHIYPRQHQGLAQQIVAQNGLLVSEFMPDVTPRAGHFPQRNRIISGLSLGVLIVEASLRSGSLITARLAAEYGREVFALPGSLAHPLAQGCHGLIQQGAKLVTNLSDILSELASLAEYCVDYSAQCTNTTLAVSKVVAPQPDCEDGLDQQQLKLLECIDYAATNVDHMVICSGLRVEQVMALLSSLELAGHVALVSGGYIRLQKGRKNHDKR